MTTFQTKPTGGFYVCQTALPPRSPVGGCAFGIDRFGIAIFTSGTKNGMQGPEIRRSGVNPAFKRAFFTYETDTDVALFLIPQPVGTGSTRGVHCISETGGEFYIKCTQTPPTGYVP